jgi:hypothetical protein
MVGHRPCRHVFQAARAVQPKAPSLARRPSTGVIAVVGLCGLHFATSPFIRTFREI